MLKKLNNDLLNCLNEYTLLPNFFSAYSWSFVLYIERFIKLIIEIAINKRTLLSSFRKLNEENNIPCVISPNITELFSFSFIKLALYLIIRVARLLPTALAIWYKIISFVFKANLKPNMEFADKITVFVAIKKVI